MLQYSYKNIYFKSQTVSKYCSFSLKLLLEIKSFVSSQWKKIYAK